MCTSELGLKSPWFGNILIVQTNQFGEVTDFDEDHEIQARDVVIGYVILLCDFHSYFPFFFCIFFEFWYLAGTSILITLIYRAIKHGLMS